MQECTSQQIQQTGVWSRKLKVKALLRLNVLQDWTYVAYFLNVSSTLLLFLCTNHTLNIWNKNLNVRKYNLKSKLILYLTNRTSYIFRLLYSHHQADRENKNKKIFTTTWEF